MGVHLEFQHPPSLELGLGMGAFPKVQQIENAHDIPFLLVIAITIGTVAVYEMRKGMSSGAGNSNGIARGYLLEFVRSPSVFPWIILEN
jgi:hypothetical protein